MGVFDAGTIHSSSSGMGSFPMQGGMMMDSAGIASGGAFLVSELEKRDPMIRKPLTSVTYPRDININTGGGWVDFVSAMSVSYGSTGGSGDSPISAGGANGIPVVQASMDKGIFKAHEFSLALSVKYVDMQKANYIGRSLDQLLQDGVRLTYDKHMDENVYTGFATYGTYGIVNHPDVTETMVAQGKSTKTNWKEKTADEILNDINTAITTTWASAGYSRDAIPNHILLPYEEYLYIMNTKVTELATQTIMDYVLENNVAAKEGSGLYIGATAWCKGAGTSNTDRMVVYVNHERFLNVDELVPLNRSMSQPNTRHGCYDTLFTANLSETQILYPNTITYWDGIGDAK